MPKFKVVVSVLVNKTLIVEADDSQSAFNFVSDVGYPAECYKRVKFADDETVEWTPMSVVQVDEVMAIADDTIDTCASGLDADLLCVVCGESFDEKQMKYLAVSANGTRCQACDTKVGRE